MIQSLNINGTSEQKIAQLENFTGVYNLGGVDFRFFGKIDMKGP